MKIVRNSLVLLLAGIGCLQAADTVTLPSDEYFAPFKALKAPQTEKLLLQPGDRLAICGDSITEQRMHSRLMETYLTVCVPQLKVTVRQYGWSGEQAPGFLSRLTNDVLRFHPTIATTCYGMNDHRYQPYTEEIGKNYRHTSEAIIQALKANHVRVVQGSPGTVGKMPAWVKSASGTVNDLNLNLLQLRNIGVELAQQEQVAFADVYLPMLVQGYEAKKQFGNDFMISGKDGVHPDWAGQIVMTYAFLKGMGLDGNIGTITFDAAKAEASTTDGHKVLNQSKNEITIESSRYPFCAVGETNRDSSMRAGMALVPFNADLNRLMLLVKGATADKYKISWGTASRSYSSAELEKGVNLAADFQVNPFSEAFNRVDDAIAKKQAYETRQVKDLFHGPEGSADMDLTALLTEKVRKPLVQAVTRSFVPVKHTIRIEAE